MKIAFGRVITGTVAAASGLIILLGYIFQGTFLDVLAIAALNAAVITAGLALLLGLLNVLIQNLRRVEAGQPGWEYHLVTAASFLLMLVIGAAEASVLPALGLTPSADAAGQVIHGAGSFTFWVFTSFIGPGQVALAGLAGVLLIAAAVRLPGRKPSAWSFIFLGAAIIALIGWLPFSPLQPLNGIYAWLAAVPIAGGARGLLIGVALGAVTMALRVLLRAEPLIEG